MSTNNPKRSAFSLLELLLVIALMALLGVLLLPALNRAQLLAQEKRAVVELRGILQLIVLYQSENGWTLPMHMQQIVQPSPRDPWGNPYVYTHFDTVPSGQVRKDRNMTPINSKFDLYSMGRDGKTSAPLTAAASLDDIIVAKDGEYVGPVKYY